jgi:predicted O-methyltransferase YrrM
MNLFNGFLKNSIFDKYQNIFTHLTKEEKLVLYKLCLSLPKHSSIVEIGSYLGASSCFLALGAKKTNSIVHCVDTWENHEMSEGLRDTYTEFIHNTDQLSKYIIPHRGWSVEIAKTFEKKMDLIFFDGGHSYEIVKADVDAWFDKLKTGGIIVMHDIGWAEGVIKVVEESVKPKLDRFDQLPNMFWGWKERN